MKITLVWGSDSGGTLAELSCNLQIPSHKSIKLLWVGLSRTDGRTLMATGDLALSKGSDMVDAIPQAYCARVQSMPSDVTGQMLVKEHRQRKTRIAELGTAKKDLQVP